MTVEKTIKKTMRLRVASVSHLVHLQDLFYNRHGIKYSEAQMIGLALSVMAEKEGIGNNAIKLKTDYSN